MEPWTAALCKNLMKRSQKIQTVHKKALTQSNNTLMLLAAPSNQLEFEDIHQDPFILQASAKVHDEICIQQDPLKNMLRLRHFIRNSFQLTPDSSAAKESFEYEFPTIHNFIEIKANKEVSHYLKPIPTASEEVLSNITNNVLSNNFLNYPFTASSVIYTLMRNDECSLIDMPDALLSINVANSLGLNEICEIYKKVLEEYQFLADDTESQEVTAGELAHQLFPELLQKPRDEFVLAILQKKIIEKSILGVVSAPTFVAVNERWGEKIDFDEVNKVKGRVLGDSDEVLVEKIAILDAVLGSKTWSDKFMYNRFPYIDKKENIDKERKMRLQGVFHSVFQKYFEPIEEIRKKLEAR